MTLEQCFKKVDKYLTSSSTTPRFVNIQNIQDLNTFLNYYHVGNNRFFTVSDYCKADEIMRIDELQNDLLSQNDNVFITRLTSYFKLQGKAVLIKQLQNFSSRSFSTHVVILCYQCEEYLNFKDNIRTSQFIYKVDGDISDIANIELSRVSFRLADGTVLMDHLQADKDLVESLGGSVAAVAADAQTELKLADVNVEIFDINSAAYQGSSVLPLMSAAVVIVVLGALVTVVLVCRPRTYE